MNQQHITPTLRACALALATLLAACGGGGGGGSNDTVTAVAATPAATPIVATTVAGIVPGDTMVWATAAEHSLAITLTGPDGQAAGGAAVRVFTLSRTSPQDGSPLDEPVPVSLLESGVADAAGHVTLGLRLPGHVTEVLVVATLGDAQAQSAVASTGRSATLGLALTR